MSWHHIMFVVDRAGHVGPRLMRKLTHLARVLDAEVELLQSAFEWGVLNKGGIGSGASDSETREAIARRGSELEHVVEALKANGVRARATVTCDKPGPLGILRHVLVSKPDLLIVQTRHHSSLARFVLSNADFKLIEMCPCPLLVMKTEKAYLEARIVAAVDPMHAHDKPAALDEAIVSAATHLAKAVGGTLDLCHAHTPSSNVLTLIDQSLTVPAADYAEQAAIHREEAEARVRALAQSAGVSASHTHVTRGDPADILPRLAQSLRTDVMVMGAVSRSALERVIIGHTAERVLDALNCDVLVIKTPGFCCPEVVREDHEIPAHHAEGGQAG